MTVYIEYVLIDNLVIDFLLLKATFALTNIDVKQGRLFVCAFLGALIALIYPLIQVKIISTLIKILSGFLLTLLATKYNSKKSYAISTLIFFIFTFLTGGAIMGIYSILGIEYSTEYSVALMFIPVYFVLRAMTSIMKFIYRRKDVVAFTFNISLTAYGKTVYGKGFLDTGNGLYDGDRPCIVCGKKFFLNFIGDNFYKTKLKKITVNTVSGQTENFAILLEELKIYISGSPNIFNNVTLLVASGSVGEGYDVILHPALLEDNYDKKHTSSLKKIS